MCNLCFSGCVRFFSVLSLGLMVFFVYEVLTSLILCKWSNQCKKKRKEKKNKVCLAFSQTTVALWFHEYNTLHEFVQCCVECLRSRVCVCVGRGGCTLSHVETVHIWLKTNRWNPCLNLLCVCVCVWKEPNDSLQFYITERWIMGDDDESVSLGSFRLRARPKDIHSIWKEK